MTASQKTCHVIKLVTFVKPPHERKEKPKRIRRETRDLTRGGAGLFSPINLIVGIFLMIRFCHTETESISAIGFWCFCSIAGFFPRLHAQPFSAIPWSLRWRRRLPPLSVCLLDSPPWPCNCADTNRRLPHRSMTPRRRKQIRRPPGKWFLRLDFRNLWLRFPKTLRGSNPREPLSWSVSSKETMEICASYSLRGLPDCLLTRVCACYSFCFYFDKLFIRCPKSHKITRDFTVCSRDFVFESSLILVNTMQKNYTVCYCVVALRFEKQSVFGQLTAQVSV